MDGLTYTTDHQRALQELGELHMRLRELETQFYPLMRLRNFIADQAMVFTPNLCCPGNELEIRIEEMEALKEMGKR